MLIELHGTNQPVADLLDALEYVATTLDHSQPIREASWNAHVLAVPRERATAEGPAGRSG